MSNTIDKSRLLAIMGYIEIEMIKDKDTPIEEAQAVGEAFAELREYVVSGRLDPEEQPTRYKPKSG